MCSFHMSRNQCSATPNQYKGLTVVSCDSLAINPEAGAWISVAMIVVF
jgi:hypothetical protein